MLEASRLFVSSKKVRDLFVWCLAILFLIGFYFDDHARCLLKRFADSAPNKAGKMTL